MEFSLSTVLIIAGLVFIYLQYTKDKGTVKISPAQAKKRMEEDPDIVLLDVRTKREYQERHIPKSVLLPLDVLPQEAGKKIPDKNAEIIVYCQSGKRSSAAARTLKKIGYTRVFNLGGLYRWPYKTVAGGKR